MASFPNVNRRMFRGRAGATDRHLPKHDARRRKRPSDSKPEVAPPDEDQRAVDYADIDNLHDDDEVVIVEPIVIADAEEPKSLPAITPIALTEDLTPAGKEIKHLLKRILNVSESITLSSSAISNPITWKNNVLNAVQNTVQEWRAILLHYNGGLEVAQIKQPAVATYLLIQQAMQTGPLTCSNPGYFKRCGTAVASVALKFLEETIPDALELRFTEKQAQAIQKWKLAAAKAVASDRPPTKSQVKKQAGKGSKK
jgi:hypothetical protein